MKKKKITILTLIAILSLIAITVGVTYAFFNYVKEGTTENTITTGSITFLYTEVDQIGAGISLQESFPISDEQGKAQIGTNKVFDFKITSTTPTANIDYEVTARKKQTENILDEEAVRIYLTEVIGEEEKELLLDNYSNLTQTEKVDKNKYVEKTLYKGKVYANDTYEKNFRLRMWIDENTDFSPVKDDEGNITYPYNNKTFTVTVNVYATGKVVTDEQIDLQSSTDIQNIKAEEEPLQKVEDEEYEYEVTLENGTENTTITVVPESENAEVIVEKIDSLAYKSNVRRLSSTKFYDLKTGDNLFKVTIISENKKNKREFTINIKVAKESINTLGKIEIEGYTIEPSFNQEELNYEVTTEEERINIIVEPTSELATASIIGNEELVWGENTINVIVTAEDGTTQVYTIKINNERPTAPTITGGSTSWVTSAPTIKPQTAGNAVSGIKHYEYYKSTENTKPTDSTVATGTTASDLKVTDEGTTYIWYRTVSNNGNKSKWSSNQVVKLDTGVPSAPTITGGSGSWSNTAKTISVSKEASATSGISYYQYCISTSTSSCNGTWTNLAAGTKSVSISTNGTRYIYFRGVSGVGTAGTASSYQTTMIDTGTPSAPTITGGSGSWSNVAKTISVSKEASATSGISYYQYCISTSTSSCNGTWTNLAAGTKSVSISTNGTRYIYFRGVSGVGTPGTASSYQTTIIDTSNPTVTVSVSGKTATFTIKDNLGTVGYGVNQSTTTQPSYVSYSTTNGSRTWTASAAGTYQVWVKDNAGRTARAQFTIASTAFCAYSAGQTWTYNYTGGSQSFTVPCSGTYKLEVWGAQGGNGQGAGGKGGYSYGNISLTNNKVLYIVVGGQGASNISSGSAAGGYNGGGSGYANDVGYEGAYAGGGGGATHIGATNAILSSTTSANLYIVAGGGGGGAKGQLVNACAGGAGGGTATAGTSANYGDGNKGYAGAIGGGSYGIGQSSTSSSTTGYVSAGGGGGAGYSGGGSGYATGYAAGGSGAGGTGYIGGVTGGSMQNGQRSGNGYARITLVTISQ